MSGRPLRSGEKPGKTRCKSGPIGGVIIRGDDHDSRNARHVLLVARRRAARFFPGQAGLKGTDVGDGWLIFDAPEADLGVHPTEGSDAASGTADISFYCDDIEATVHELQSRGVEFTQKAEDHGFGFVTFFNVPGGFKVQLYQPKYRK